MAGPTRRIFRIRDDDVDLTSGAQAATAEPDEVPALQARLVESDAELRATVAQLDLANRELAAVASDLEAAALQLAAVEEETEVIDQEMRVRTEQVALGHDILDRLLEAIDEPVLILDGDLRLQTWSRGAVDAWGIDPDEGYAVPLAGLRGSLDTAVVVELARRAAASPKETQSTRIEVETEAGSVAVLRAWRVTARGVDSTGSRGVDAVIVIGHAVG
ncbi:MAG: hypothetical protein GXY13_15680 [Acidimicrobiales bacterium]|nr:hypothetical protein [Acidimicrobiales bacterium]